MVPDRYTFKDIPMSFHIFTLMFVRNYFSHNLLTLTLVDQKHWTEFKRPAILYQNVVPELTVTATFNFQSIAHPGLRQILPHLSIYTRSANTWTNTSMSCGQVSQSKHLNERIDVLWTGESKQTPERTHRRPVDRWVKANTWTNTSTSCGQVRLYRYLNEHIDILGTGTNTWTKTSMSLLKIMIFYAYCHHNYFRHQLYRLKPSEK